MCEGTAERFPDDADLMYDYANATALSGAYEQALQIISNAKQMKYFEDAKARFCFLEAEICAELWKYGSGNRKM